MAYTLTGRSARVIIPSRQAAHYMTERGKKAGRPKEILTSGTSNLQLEIPAEVARAFELYAVRIRKKRVAVVREYLEDVLVREGLLEVHIRKDPDTGRVMKSYKVIEP